MMKTDEQFLYLHRVMDTYILWLCNFGSCFRDMPINQKGLLALV